MKIFKHQFWHLVCLSLLMWGLVTYLPTSKSALAGSLWGVNTEKWLFWAIIAPIAHQIYVVITWRWELYYKGISRIFGKNGFRLFKIGFGILILARPVLITLLAISNNGSLELLPELGYAFAIVLAVPAAYLFYSVKTYFGIDRAFGIDHFEPEKYRSKPFEKGGIFKYTSNGMYIYGFLLMWIPGFLFHSEAALVVALFNHLYIWVHYYFTELPDIHKIYVIKETRD